ncbi:hypothetical protein AWENTII_002626 [Aspergillus wentii]
MRQTHGPNPRKLKKHSLRQSFFPSRIFHPSGDISYLNFRFSFIFILFYFSEYSDHLFCLVLEVRHQQPLISQKFNFPATFTARFSPQPSSIADSIHQRHKGIGAFSSLYAIRRK